MKVSVLTISDCSVSGNLPYLEVEYRFGSHFLHKVLQLYQFMKFHFLPQLKKSSSMFYYDDPGRCASSKDAKYVFAHLHQQYEYGFPFFEGCSTNMLRRESGCIITVGQELKF